MEEYLIHIKRWNNDKCWWECKKHHICTRDNICNAALCSGKNGKYLASITDDSVIARAETIDAEAKSNDKETKTVSTNFDEKILLVKHNISIFYLLFY